MAQAAPTPAPNAAVARRGNIEKRAFVFAPLTQAWTPPASCATNAPTIEAGTCGSTGCSAYPTASVTRSLSADGANVNVPHYTTSNVMTSTACMPPGYQAMESFYFTSATGCPPGYLTATTSSALSTLKVACCPSNYPRAEYLVNNGFYNCYTYKAIPSGAVFTLAAYGPIYTSGVVDYYTESIIGTTAWPTATSASIVHPAVNLMFASSFPPSAGIPGSDAADAVAAAGFTLFSLGLGASIAIVVVIAVVGLSLLGCLFCCIRVVLGRRRNKTVNNTTVVAPGAAPAAAQYAPVPTAYGQPSPQPYGQPSPQPYAPYGSPGVQPGYEQKYPNAHVSHA